MSTLVLFLFCLFIPNIHPCLVIRYVEPPKCNCPYMALDNSNIQSQVANHPFYSNVSSRPIISPIVSIDECYGSVYCEGDYSLVVFDTESATNFGEYAADGLCDRYTQTWLVDDDSGGFRTFHRLYATCVDFKDYGSCKPKNTTPLLFAYSNDLDPNITRSIYLFMYPDFSYMANVRFDTQQEDEIEYHKTELPDYFNNIGVWANAIYSRPPDPSLRIANNETGSDAFKVIEKFLDNTEIPICGSKIVLMVKRLPNEVDIERLVQKMRRNHIWIYIFASMSPSGGNQKQTLYNLAARTNGYCLFDTDDRLVEVVDRVDPSYKRHLVYAVNRQISGQGTIELPSLTAYFPNEDYYYYYLSMSFEDTVQSFPYSHVTLRWENNKTSLSTAVNKNMNYKGTEHGQYFVYLDEGVNSFWLEYNYADDKVRTIQIRMTNDQMVEDWLPYDN